jgi:putative membrane protein
LRPRLRKISKAFVFPALVHDEISTKREQACRLRFATGSATWGCDTEVERSDAMQRQVPRQRGDRGWWIGVVVLLLVVSFVPLLGGGMMGPGMMGGYPGNGIPFTGNGWLWGLGTGLGWLMMVAFWGALIAGAILLFRAIGGQSETPPTASETPLDTLKHRYASGEITREEYETMRQALAA